MPAIGAEDLRPAIIIHSRMTKINLPTRNSPASIVYARHGLNLQHGKLQAHAYKGLGYILKGYKVNLWKISINSLLVLQAEVSHIPNLLIRGDKFSVHALRPLMKFEIQNKVDEDRINDKSSPLSVMCNNLNTDCRIIYFPKDASSMPNSFLHRCCYRNEKHTSHQTIISSLKTPKILKILNDSTKRSVLKL